MKEMNRFNLLMALALSVPMVFMGCSKQQVSKADHPVTDVANVVDAASHARTSTASGGTFNVLTYNIAGLPQILSSASTPRDSSTSLIGRMINAYDMVHVQEDFNYHAYLYDYGNVHPYRSSTSGGAGIGDGLNSLSYFGMTDFARITWNTRINENALTPKGFTYCRYRLAEGVYVDVYNLHTNAEADDASIAARADNLQQLSDYIAANSKGNAVIVMGDTNGRYTRDNNLLLLLNVNGMNDPWVDLIRSGSIPALGADAIVCTFPDEDNSCEIVDKIYYRGNKYVRLSASDYQLLKTFVNADGEQLSDHLPLTVNFTYALQPAFDMSDLFGGPHGTPFNDLETLTSTSALSTLTIRGGSRLDKVQTTLADGTVLGHGGTGGTAQSLTLNSGEYISSVALAEGSYNGNTRIFYFKATTSTGRTLSTGTSTSDAVTYTAPTGYKITGFYGNSGDEVDKLGLVYTKL